MVQTVETFEEMVKETSVDPEVQQAQPTSETEALEESYDAEQARLYGEQ